MLHIFTHFFHPHVFPKNTNNIVRITLPNGPYMFWNMFCDFFYYNVLRFRSLHSCSFLFLDQKMFNILRFKVLNYNSSKKKVVNYKCEFFFFFHFMLKVRTLISFGDTDNIILFFFFFFFLNDKFIYLFC